MDILTSSLKPEIDKVLKGARPPVNHLWEVVFHCRGEESVRALYVTERNLIRNYAKAFSDQLSLTVALPEGDYTFALYPSKEILEATVTMTPLYSGSAFKKNEDGVIVSKRYKVVLVDRRSPVLEQNTPTLPSRDVANRSNIIAIQIQLIDPVIDHIRKSAFGTTFRNSIGANALRVFLGIVSDEANEGTTRAIKGVDLSPGYSERTFEHCVVPHHTQMEQVPSIIDSESGGIYPTGTRYYLQDDQWFVYPIYDLKRYDQSERVVNVINIPRGRLTGIETSYRRTTNQVIILATGETKHFDPTDTVQLQEGNAVRFFDAVKFFDEAAKVTGNKAVADISTTLSEITIEPRENDTDIARLSETPLTTRYYKEMSKLAERSGFYIQIAWENADPDILYPGMPAKFSYLNGSDQIEELYGTLVGVQSRDTPTTNNLVERRFSCTAAITLFLERKVRNTK
jgi:hypothetical protein